MHQSKEFQCIMEIDEDPNDCSGHCLQRKQKSKCHISAYTTEERSTELLACTVSSSLMPLKENDVPGPPMVVEKMRYAPKAAAEPVKVAVL